MGRIKKHWALVMAVAMLLSTWGSLQMLSRGESPVFKKPFAEFPLTLADRWSGKELGMDKSVLEVLNLTDYMMRVYVPFSANASRPPAGMPVYLYVGYYQSQRTGATYHSPKNCLPGAGWQFVQAEQTSVPVPGGKSVTVNQVLIEKGLDKQVILYWYQDRGRVVANEYWAKAYLIWDAMTKHRTDGALVRISLPVTKSTEEAYQEGFAFMRDVWPSLQEYLPDGADTLTKAS